MAVAAKLGACNLVKANLGWPEVNRYVQARNHILTNAQWQHLETVNNILRCQVDGDASRGAVLIFFHWNHDVGLEHLNVVLGMRIGLVDAKRISTRNKGLGLGTEFPVGTGITGVPGKLLGRDANHAVIAEVIRLVDIKIPEVRGHHDEDQF